MMRRVISAVAVGVLAVGEPGLGLAQPVLASAQQVQAPAPQQPAPGDVQQTGGSQSSTFTLRVESNIVLNNVVVRDKKTGAVVKGLKASDFTVLENNKPQKIVSFDFQNVDEAAVLNEKATVMGKARIADMLENNFAATPEQLRDHRLIVMFFDLSSMQDEDIDRAVDAAKKYVNEQMAPADLVAMVSMSTGLSLDQDFTSDKAALLKVLGRYDGDDASGFGAGGTGSTDATPDDTTAFAADDSEFNSLNTDRELFAIRAISKSLERVNQKKSMLYFSGGLTRNGIENQASLRSATNEAAKANLAIYSVDTRGLQALPPVGDASKASLRGTSGYNGRAATAQLAANYASQETLDTLSRDTGGKAFFDSNDFGPAFTQVQKDTEAYYLIGFRSTNSAKDGTYRHLTIKIDRNDVKLEYRPGYYASADFQHQKNEDREQALQEQMHSDLPATDVPVYLQAMYFRQSATDFYVPVTLLIPGSAIPFVKNGDREKATIDILGEVRRPLGRIKEIADAQSGGDAKKPVDANFVAVGKIRDTVPLKIDESQQVTRKNIQYTTGFTLGPGTYHLKFVVRENQTGNMGSFETDIVIPDLKKTPMKLSSVVLASQRQPNNGKNATNLLVRDGEEYVPNVAHVFRQDQHLYFLYEVYDPTTEKDAPKPAASPGLERRTAGPVRVLTSIEFLLGGAKVYETPLVTADAVNVPGRDAVAFQFDVPLTQLKPGTYVCQVNVIDDAGGSFTFPRMALKVTAGAPATVAPAPAATATGAGSGK